MDICLSDSCLTLQCWQKNFWSEPSFSGLVKRSKHPMRVDIPQPWLDKTESISPLQAWDFVVECFAVPWPGSKSSEMSTQGSYVVDVKPQTVQVTSDLKIPENTLWAIQHSPLPVLPTNYDCKKCKRRNTYIMERVFLVHCYGRK